MSELRQFLTVKASEVMAHDDALGEGFMHGHREAASELGEPHQQQAEAVL
ncbi:MAG: hypothetical protein ACREYF_08860 [Gammaproteobacteria bacterium]